MNFAAAAMTGVSTRANLLGLHLPGDPRSRTSRAGAGRRSGEREEQGARTRRVWCGVVDGGNLGGRRGPRRI